MDLEMDAGIDSKIMKEVDPKTEKETWSLQSAPSSTEEWDRGTTYEYSPKESKFFRPPLQRPILFVILGRILTASTLPAFMNLWANTFFPYPSLILHTLTSLTNNMEKLNDRISMILGLLSSHPFITETQGWPNFVHNVLYKRLTSGLALIDDFQNLIQECEKRIYSSVAIPQGTYVEMQRENRGSIGCRMAESVLREFAGGKRTRILEAGLKDWDWNTNKWVEEGMKVVEQEENRVGEVQWILEGDDWFWQDDLYRPMER